MLLAISAIVGSSCSRRRTLAKGFGARSFSSPLAKPLQPVGRMKVSKVGLLSFACNPSRTLIQSSSPVCAKTAHRPSAESTHADPLRPS